jgi:branched-chain amino acid transport system permease protein
VSESTADSRLGSVSRDLLDFGDSYAWHLLAGVLLLLGLPALPALLGAFGLVGSGVASMGLQGGFYMTLLVEMLVFAVLALSWDLVGGQTGYPSFGNMAFFGVGAYTTAILWKDFGLGLPLAVLVAGPVAAAFAVVVGLAVLRLRGHYFAIGTLGVLLAAQQFSRYLEITGGSSGKVLLGAPPEQFFYAFYVGLLVVEIGVVLYLSQTRFGLVLNAIRDDERKATAMGVNTTYYKTAAWTIAALFTGFAGGAFGVFSTFVDPRIAWNLSWNVELIAMALIGGTGTVAGPVIGAFALHFLIVQIETLFTGFQLMVLGAVVIVTVVAFPDGVVGTLRERASAMRYYEFGGGSQAAETDGSGDRTVETDGSGRTPDPDGATRTGKDARATDGGEP